MFRSCAVVLLLPALLVAQPKVIESEFIYDEASFASCHASTIVESKNGLVAAWFGGPREGHKDVGIWLSRKEGKSWTKPVEVANGVESEEKRYPCWNPVLFQPSKGPLLLFYKVGPSPSAWWGMLITSDDGGKSWSKPKRLPENILGPIKNKPIELADGTLLSGSSTESREDGWRVFMERSKDPLGDWTRVGPLNDGKTIGAIQPCILDHGDGKLQVLCRSRQTKIVQSFSKDNGKSWEPLRLTELPNPNSGIDAVTLKDGRHLLIYNHTESGRSPINIAVSKDGQKWDEPIVLEQEPGKEFSYPAIIQTKDGLVHATYTWKRQKVKHVVLKP